MDNENLVFDIKHENWGENSPGSWESTVWKIYGDLKTVITLTVNSRDKKIKKTKISQKDFDCILALMKQSEKDDKKSNALDGSAWSIKRYQGKTLIWERKMGYIYGVKSLKTLAGILYKIAGFKKIDW